jgi:hypothetical protein
MDILLLMILSCISLFVIWFILRVWCGKKLRENIAKRERNREARKRNPPRKGNEEALRLS